MATLGYQIDPNPQTSLRSEMAQGANVGDKAYGSDGRLYDWTGAGWSLSGGGGGSSSYPTFNFDWEKTRQDALTQLTPYYEQKLKEAGGDVERAKRLIEEDYKTGVRVSKEDLSTTETQSAEDLATSMKTLGLDIAEENRNLSGTLNERGVLTGQRAPDSTSSAAPTSEYAKTWHLQPTAERQDLRKLAIERAILRQNQVAKTRSEREIENLTTARARGIEEQDIQYPRTQRDIETEKREKAFNVATPMKYNEELAKYRAVNNLG